jgi:hypothetical protein
MIFNSAKKNIISCLKFFSGMQLECVNSFNYLGIIFHSNGKFESAIARLNDKAQKALFAMYRTLWDNNECYSVRLSCKLFDSLVRPVMLYGADIWGGFMFNLLSGAGGNKNAISSEKLLSKLFNDKLPIEKLHIKYCKQALGVHRKASNNACRAEIGRFPISIYVATIVFKYHQSLFFNNTKNTILEF